MVTTGRATQHTPWLRTMADGTIKQQNPFTGDHVWTVPGRADRPMSASSPDPRPLQPTAGTQTCAFCAGRLLDTPPEVVRSVKRNNGFERLRQLLPHQLDASVPEFRRTPNLFQIVSVDYWQANYGFTMPGPSADWWSAYAAAPGGRDHLLRITRQRLGSRASGLGDAAVLAEAADFFASTHDVVMARRHYVDGAVTDDQLASSGTLTPAEHRELIGLTAEAISDLYAANSGVRYVSAFQNWLRPAGASFDHLHKQVLGIDEHGVRLDQALELARRHPDIWNERVMDLAVDQGLVIAENDGAIAIAGVGHRFPSVEVWSRSAVGVPGEASEDEITAVSDLVHALHAAAGPTVPCNEEWHHTPPDADVQMPWHVVLKWRVSTPAGFEGDTKIYTNTIGPWDIAVRTIGALDGLAARGRLAEGIRYGQQARVASGALPPATRHR